MKKRGDRVKKRELTRENEVERELGERVKKREFRRESDGMVIKTENK
jgi:hypothetical protein